MHHRVCIFLSQNHRYNDNESNFNAKKKWRFHFIKQYVLKYFLCRHVFFFQSSDPVNDFIIVIKYVVSLLNLTQKSVNCLLH